jgi:hypothetical protein
MDPKRLAVRNTRFVQRARVLTISGSRPRTAGLTHQESHPYLKTQLTLRGFDGDLEKAIRTLAKQEGISLNLAALMLLRRGAGLERGKSNVNPNAIGASYDDLIGT